MADWPVATSSAFLVDNASVVREGGRYWHAEGVGCAFYGNHVHPKARPPVIIFAGRAGVTPDDLHGGATAPPGTGQPSERPDGPGAPPPHPIPRWEVRVSHYREDGTAASDVEIVRDMDAWLPIGPWSRVRAAAGAIVARIQSAERAAGR